MTLEGLAIRRVELDSPAAVSLIAALDAELAAMYPEPGANHFRLAPAEVAAADGAFVIAELDGRPVACGALRRLEAGGGVGELKRMYVDPAVRGRGIGRAVLVELEAIARQLELSRLVLETGVRQDDALVLYRRAGFVEIPLFGEYLLSPATSVCMGKDLIRSGA